MDRKTADEKADKCGRFEYDESGLGRIYAYGYNCNTCINNSSCKMAKEVE